MINFKIGLAAAGVGLAAIVAPPAHATTVKLAFNYMATNIAGDFGTASGGTAIPVADMWITDHNDLALENPNWETPGVYSGVRITVQLRPNGLSQFSSGSGSLSADSLYLNIPNAIGGGDDDDDDGGGGGPPEEEPEILSTFSNVFGVPVDVEWAPDDGEEFETNGWEFTQEIEWQDGQMNQLTGFSVFDLFSGADPDDGIFDDNINVDTILDNLVSREGGPGPDAIAWLMLQTEDGGIAGSGWWGLTPCSEGECQLDVLATDFEIVTLESVPVPVPAAVWLFGSALVGMATISRRRRRA